MSFITGTAVDNYRIPNNPGQPPAFTVPGVGSFDSSQLNEHQFEQNYFNVAAYQQTVGNVDYQISAFSRYSSLNFIPDPIGDLVFNGVASTVSRSSFLNGLQGDAAIRLDEAQTLRFGFMGSGEQAQTSNSSVVFPADPDGNAEGPPFTEPTDAVSKTGWLFGVYAQDEWKITRQLTLNAGLRFDQMDEFISANQLSPRISPTYTPFENTTFHAGYARYFTPPEMALSAPVNLAEYQGTTQQPAVDLDSPVQPERSNVFEPASTRNSDHYSRPQRLLQTRDRFDRRWAIRPGPHFDSLQLRQSMERRGRGQDQISERRFPGLRQRGVGPSICDRCRIKPVSLH